MQWSHNQLKLIYCDQKQCADQERDEWCNEDIKWCSEVSHNVKMMTDRVTDHESLQDRDVNEKCDEVMINWEADHQSRCIIRVEQAWAEEKKSSSLFL